MSLRATNENVFGCDQCGVEQIVKGATTLPEGWLGLGLAAGLSHEGGWRPNAGSTLCPTIHKNVVFCGDGCYADWLDQTFNAMLKAAKDGDSGKYWYEASRPVA